LAGYAFGTEDRVFTERYVGFNSNVPENSYVGLALQLGVLGLIAFAALVLALVLPAVRALPRLGTRELRLAAACLGTLAAGLVLACFQSYIYAAGNNATAAVWICTFMLAAIGTTHASSQRI
jgi:O-antigen ligase